MSNGEGTPFSSLMDLVASHVSKTSLQESEGNDYSQSVLSMVHRGISEPLLPPPQHVFNLPRPELVNSDINDVLNRQLKNMLISKERRKQQEEEEKRILEKARLLKLKKKQDLIDLSAAIIQPGTSKAPHGALPSVTQNKYFDPELITDDKNLNVGNAKACPITKVLPCQTDMSYIMKEKIRKCKGSTFGKVLSSRLRPSSAPYIRTAIRNQTIMAFDFSTPSPCDINKALRLRPPPDPYAHMNMVERYMAMTKDET